MNELERIFVFEEKGKSFTNSLNVAEIFGKRHDNVLQSIQNLGCSENFRLLNFQESSYLNSQNKEMLMYNMSKDGFAFLAFSFTGKSADQFKEAYITRFNQMEETIRKQALELKDLRQILQLNGLSNHDIAKLEKENLKSDQVQYGFSLHDSDYISQFEFYEKTGYRNNLFFERLFDLKMLINHKGYYVNRIFQTKNAYYPKVTNWGAYHVQCATNNTLTKLNSKRLIYDLGFCFRAKKEIFEDYLTNDFSLTSIITEKFSPPEYFVRII